MPLNLHHHDGFWLEGDQIRGRPTRPLILWVPKIQTM